MINEFVAAITIEKQRNFGGAKNAENWRESGDDFLGADA
jgi:hypothetical protein